MKMNTIKGDTPIYNDITLQEIENFPIASQRGFTKKYYIPPKTPEMQSPFYFDVCVKKYTNEVCVIYLAEGNSLLTENKIVNNINFIVNGVDRLQNKANGKFKKMAQNLTANSPICYIETKDGLKIPFYSGVSGKLLEINEKLTKQLEKFTELSSDNFVALLLPNNPKSIDQLLNEEQYKEILCSREKNEQHVK